jgi:cytochrome c biogenesis protein CcmG, thiol:disulfide interchange protein DsbE
MMGRARLAAQAVALAAVAGLLVLLVWKVATGEGSEVPARLEPGKSVMAPEFELPRLDRGGTLSLASLRGKAVVVNFWASWCDPCREEAPLLEAAWKKYRSRGLVVVGVDYDDFSGDARAFARRNGMTYPLVQDKKKTTVSHYDVTGVPETFFVDREGRLVGELIAGPVEEQQLADNIELALGPA